MPGPTLILTAVLAAALLVPPAGSPAAGGVADDEVRGLWVTRGSLASTDSIRTLVHAAQTGGFNTLLVQVRGRGEAFYLSRLEPRATELERQSAGFDPLALTLELAHGAGLKVHAWVNVNLVSSAVTLPRDRGHVVSRHPEWLMVPRALAASLAATEARSPAYIGSLARWTRGASAAVEGLYLSPIPADSRAYTAGVVRELVEGYDLDGVHFDYIRYPNDDFDYGPAALAEFRESIYPTVPPAERLRLDRATAFDPAAWASTFPSAWADFRRERLTDLARDLQHVARAARPGIVVSAAVIPSASEARDHRFQDWIGWARTGILDVICPMIYTTNPEEFAATVADLDAQSGTTPFWAGIGAFRLPVTRTIDHVRLARRANASGVLLFSYDQLADTGSEPAHMSALRAVLLEAAGGSGSAR